ncbi:hypothetical protein ACFVJK_46160 [Streptomyces sp. NPDC127172]
MRHAPAATPSSAPVAQHADLLDRVQSRPPSRKFAIAVGGRL